jgi:hypothetical protein
MPLESRRAAVVVIASLLAACGGSSSSAPDPVLLPESITATPTPAPTATPTPAPSPSPAACGGCEAPVTNAAPPARLTIKVYKVVDRNEVLQPLTDRDPIPVGFKVTIDATAKDANEQETNGVSGWVAFFIDDEDVAQLDGNHAFQRKVKASAPGTVQVWANLDGVRSNTLTLRFVER